MPESERRQKLRQQWNVLSQRKTSASDDLARLDREIEKTERRLAELKSTRATQQSLVDKWTNELRDIFNTIRRID